MDPERIILGEATQNQKDKCGHTLSDLNAVFESLEM